MNDPTRLLESSDDEFERALLESARRDRGSERARLRALATFGALGLNLVSTTVAASPGAFATAVASSGVAVPSLSVGLLAKWLGTGVIAGSVSIGSVYAIQTQVREAAAPPPVTTEEHELAPGAARPVQGARAPTPELPAPVGEARPSTREPATTLAGEPPEPTSEGTIASSGAFPLDAPSSRLRDELAALERARGALRSGNHAGALEELARYTARFQRGALSQEATLLAVEARLAAGDTEGARAVAQRVLAVDSTSPHARRLQALLSRKESR